MQAEEEEGADAVAGVVEEEEEGAEVAKLARVEAGVVGDHVPSRRSRVHNQSQRAGPNRPAEAVVEGLLNHDPVVVEEEEIDQSQPNAPVVEVIVRSPPSDRAEEVAIVHVQVEGEVRACRVLAAAAVIVRIPGRIGRIRVRVAQTIGRTVRTIVPAEAETMTSSDFVPDKEATDAQALVPDRVEAARSGSPAAMVARVVVAIGRVPVICPAIAQVRVAAARNGVREGIIVPEAVVDPASCRTDLAEAVAIAFPITRVVVVIASRIVQVEEEMAHAGQMVVRTIVPNGRRGQNVPIAGRTFRTTTTTSGTSGSRTTTSTLTTSRQTG